MTCKSYRHKVEEAAYYIQKNSDIQPEIIIQLGTGLGGLTEKLEISQLFPFAKIPHFPKLSVETHTGNLFLGSLGGKSVAILQGRAHYYEGYTCQEITTPLRVLSLLGCHTFIVSNSAGGLNPNFKAGTLMVIRDHINAIGENPLRGPNVETWGPRFPDMSEVYSKRLRHLFKQTAERTHLSVQSGVYAAIPGPSLETPAETRLLQHAGADAVGMSTVPEVIVAKHAGLEVLGISVLANINNPENFQAITLNNILAEMKKIEPIFQQLLVDIITEM